MHFYKKKLISYLNTNYITIRLYLKKESSPDLDPYIGCPKINSKYYKSI